jgi:hypothetical protein
VLLRAWRPWRKYWYLCAIWRRLTSLPPIGTILPKLVIFAVRSTLTSVGGLRVDDIGVFQRPGGCGDARR